MQIHFKSCVPNWRCVLIRVHARGLILVWHVNKLLYCAHYFTSKVQILNQEKIHKALH